MSDTSAFGIWAMLAFWASAIGGIAIAITWGKTRGRNPGHRDLLIKSLNQRLDKGEISQEEYQRKVDELPGRREE
ncbi:MAG: SHOCT domain-containing protein [Gammaproteobacteria bacterium]|nr:SHOCT domain-containing protein [Gammaproteobacteria bacterium]